LLDRHVINDEDRAILRRFSEEVDGRPRGEREDGKARRGDIDVETRVEDVLLTRSTGWILGTSIAFTGIVLLACCVIFSRRDF
jgi:hypothetical protein